MLFKTETNCFASTKAAVIEGMGLENKNFNNPDMAFCIDSITNDAIEALKSTQASVTFTGMPKELAQATYLTEVKRAAKKQPFMIKNGILEGLKKYSPNSIVHKNRDYEITFH